MPYRALRCCAFSLALAAAPSWAGGVNVCAHLATVGAHGDAEPIIAAAPDGTLYISGLQYMFRSDNAGSSWTPITTPIYASSLELASDSSISIDAGGKLYFTFDWPYAGATAVCTSTDKGVNWNCDPAALPGGTDRMWVLAGAGSNAYMVTNQGLYQTIFFRSTDGGTSWVPLATAQGITQPQTGPLLQKTGSTKVIQPVKTDPVTDADGSLASLGVYIFNPADPTKVLSDVVSVYPGGPLALPSGAFDSAGALYLATENLLPSGARQVIIARSLDEGATWKTLPPLPGSEGTDSTNTTNNIFTWVAAAEPGHIGLVYYTSTTLGAATTGLSNATWDAVWAESRDANTDTPTWTVMTLEKAIHHGGICIAAGCSDPQRFAGGFITSTYNTLGVPFVAYMRDTNSIRSARVAVESATQITAPASVTPGSTGKTASVPNAGTGATYDWTIGNGTITAGAGTRTITFTAGTVGPVKLDVAILASNSSCLYSASVPVQAPQTGSDFYSVTPCRAVDTRNPSGPLAGPSLVAGAMRAFALAGAACGIPTDASALAMNLTVINPPATGFLKIVPAGAAIGESTAMNFTAGQTRANNGVYSLLGTPAGSLAVQAGMASGTVDFVLDVVGYFK